ncbi:MAG: amino acid permease [Bifidobacteriaceae bacterium]|jgi:D-serine/D-alanine/glycine transporter|nr:amino acid permease [Bifidobacteriaceae bacterium]
MSKKFVKFKKINSDDRKERPESYEDKKLVRGLSNRHLQLIAIGGTIGTSLFLGSQKTISMAGPSIVLAYLISGVVTFIGMRILGEMILSNLKFNSLKDVATHYLGHWAGFMVGWMYWSFWIVTGMQDAVAVSIYLKPFFPALPLWIPGVAVVFFIFILNSITVKLFGELEFWLSFIKIAAISALIIVGFYLIFSHQSYTYVFEETKTSQVLTSEISNLWQFDGFFPKGFTGFLLGLQLAFLAYAGVETVGMTAAETRDPEKTIPKAINAIPWRISIFYVGAIFVTLCVVPWSNMSNSGSPFVGIFSTVGLPAASVIMTFVLVTAAISGANSGLYSTSRMLYGLSLDGQASNLFSKLSRKMIPEKALIFSVIVILVPVSLVSFLKNPMDAFTIFASWATGCLLTVWLLLLFSFLSYLKKRPGLHKKSIMPTPCPRPLAIFVIGFFILIIAIMCFDTVPRIGLILSASTAAVLYLAYKYVVKSIEHVVEM